MPTDGDTPSGGWREVYAAMAVSTSAEAPAPCPDCGDETVRVDEQRRLCTDHGTFVPAD